MTPRRRDRVAPPPGAGEWEIRYANNDAVKGWEELCRHAPGPTKAAWMHMQTTPRAKDSRHGQLHGNLATENFDGRMLDRWQIEVTGGGRVWYLIDDEKQTVWLHTASPGHPKATDR